MPPRKASSGDESFKTKRSQEWEKDSDDGEEEEEGGEGEEGFGDLNRKGSEERKRVEEEANEKESGKKPRKRRIRPEQLETGGKTVPDTLETGEPKRTRTPGRRIANKKPADQDTTGTENEGQKKPKVGLGAAVREGVRKRKEAEEKARQDKRDEEARKDKEREKDREDSPEIQDSEQGSEHTQVSQHTQASEHTQASDHSQDSKDNMGRLDREKRDKQATQVKRTTAGMTVDELHAEYNRVVKEIHEKDLPAIQNTIQGFADLNKEIEDFGNREDYKAMMALARASLEKDGKYVPLAYEEYRGAMPVDVDADGNPRRTMLLKLKDDFEGNDEAAMKKMKKRIEDLKKELEKDRDNDRIQRDLQRMQKAELERAKKKVKRLEAEVRGIARTANDKWAAEIKAKNEEIAKLRERQKEMMEELQKYQEKERGG
ncbi:hypothetical protein HYFRA_00010462 [Hymenoscyphus fraxineus]|uniref:Uncharacterized protein n=1 Tax=Hymenoscyphus fraxineus TaxID=746836 RepID=A0A9N9L0P9_9HELO|nr:hypothetical protein HYFRA_00010462 [Hymenoscyphus fraxineus]